MSFLLFEAFCVSSLFCYAVFSVLSSFAVILMRMGEMVALLRLSSRCLVKAHFSYSGPSGILGSDGKQNTA